MKMRNETIKKVSEFLGEDVTDQFGKNEVAAALEGKKYFYVENEKKDRIRVENIYHENADVLDYAVTSYKIILEGN